MRSLLSGSVSKSACTMSKASDERTALASLPQPLSEKGWRLKLMDRPGFGQSPSRGPDDMAADAILIADRLGDGSHLIGHSFGGAEALLATARRPDAVRSLILVEPALQPMLSTDPESDADPATQAATAIIMRHLMSAATPAEFAIGFLMGWGHVQPARTMWSPPRSRVMGDWRPTWGAHCCEAAWSRPPACGRRRMRWRALAFQC